MRTEAGKKAHVKAMSKRRNYDFIPLFDNPFPLEISVDYHHLLNDFYAEDKECVFVIPMPSVTHNFVGGHASGREHWRFNALWIKRLFGIDVKGLLSGDM